MSDEYKALRDEILKWQDRRFDVVKISVGLVTALLGLKLVVEPPSRAEIWPLVSSVLLLYLCAANLLTWYAGVANAKLAAYLKVFLETTTANASGFRWEGRLQRLKQKGLDPQNVNIWIAVIYVVLAVLSVAIPFATAKCPLSGTGAFTLLPLSGVLFAGTVFVVLRFSYPRERYESYWREIRKEENGHT